MFAVRFLKNANRQLRKLDPPVARRMIARLEWLSEHFEEITSVPLSGELAGLFKYREGDYRILYEPLHAERLIIIHEIGHRREVYKKRRT